MRQSLIIKPGNIMSSETEQSVRHQWEGGRLRSWPWAGSVLTQGFS